jgi:murein DD-endopeptidase MepM/ murein hydrolase activator NlpD
VTRIDAKQEIRLMPFIAQDRIEQAKASAPNQQVGSRRAIARLSAYMLAAGLIATFVTDPLLQTVQRIYEAIVHDQYALYRARLDQDHLREVNSRLKSELVALKSSHTKQGSDLEQRLSQKLELLEDAVESATALGFFKRGRNERGGQVLADRGSPKPDPKSGARGKLAAILNAPTLEGKRSKKAIGGSEAPCSGELCRFGVSKKGVALYRPEALEVAPPPALTPAPSTEPLEQELLDQRLDRAVAIVRGLPIGAPVAGEVTSGFGHRRSPFSKRKSFHHGVDLSLRVGGHVMATGDGTITRVAHNHTYGTLIDIQHPTGVLTRYAHLSRVFARPGQQVRRGQVIASSGNTGRSTGPHLHYEVIRGGKAINPAPYIALADKLARVMYEADGVEKL